MKRKARNGRKIRLLAKKHEEKAWAAVVAVGGEHRWVSIDEVGDFLAKRQVDATSVKFSGKDPNSRYALRPGVSKHPKGWEQHGVATALSSCVDKRLLEHQRREDGNYFKAIPPTKHDIWGLVDDYVPIDPQWSQT